MRTEIDYDAKFKGVILGTAVGDALGLPREGMSRRRGLKMFGAPPLHHRFIFGRGLCSDDTEHTIMVAQALLESQGEPQRFAEALARRLRWWLLGLPAGIGWATLRSILKLWAGRSPERSGVFSAGNGPAMRAAIIGVYAAEQSENLNALVHVSTRITHCDPKAEQGALVIALASRHAVLHGPDVRAAEVFSELQNEITDPELLKILESVRKSVEARTPANEFATALGCSDGVSGYIYQTVPAALYCWLRSPGDFREVVEQTIALGGDADTTGAIAGGLSGATTGAAGIPAEWVEGLIEWPRNARWMLDLGERLALQQTGNTKSPTRSPNSVFTPYLLVRNVLFMAIVLGHGFRRMFPPY